MRNLLEPLFADLFKLSMNLLLPPRSPSFDEIPSSGCAN
jgi:hypothetical protein